MNKLSRLFLVFIFTYFGFIYSVHALFFERRKKPITEISWFVYPVAGSIPGVQDFYGLGATVSSIGDTDSDITAVSLKGKAEYFDEDFKIDFLSIFDIPLFSEHLTFNWFSTKIINVGWPEGQRGIDSDGESMYYLLARQVDASGGEISFNIYDNQLEAYFGYSDGSVKPYGLVDPNGNFFSAQDANIIESPRGYRLGLYLDDTDNRRDPRIGYRFQYEKWAQPSTRSGNSEYYQEDFNLTGYIPVLDKKKGVLVLNQFFGSSTVLKKGTVDLSQFVCDNTANPGCQALLDELYARQLREAENGKATSLGGTNRLRGYPTNRFYDSYTNFRGAEFRWYAHEVQNAFDFVLEKGTFAGIQIALFYEQGTVSDNKSNIWKNMKNSYGAGTRFLFNNVIVRIDRGYGREGGQTTFFVGYPF
tara:strand:- start:22 stop:1275 length:1254 start_codon:yes stop_codon:yes gene_type:complete